MVPKNENLIGLLLCGYRFDRFSPPSPQPVRRKDQREEPKRAECKKRPDEEEPSARPGDAARDADTFAPHVEVGNGQRKKPSKESDDVPQSPFREHQRSIQPDDEDEYSGEISERPRLDSTANVVRQVK